jgi:opacity protein-like surface antigen
MGREAVMKTIGCDRVRRLLSAVLTAAASLLLASGAEAAAAGSDSDHWLIAPYLWAPHLKGKVGLGPLSVPLDIKPQELAGGINAGAMGYLQWSNERHFFYLEGIGIQFADRKFQPLFNQSVKAEVLFSEIGYGRRYPIDSLFSTRSRMRLSPYIGVRHIRADARVDSPLLGLDADERWLVPAVGVIVEAPLTQRLGWMMKLDGAGFGIDHNRYWSGLAGLTFSATDSLALAATYRIARFHAQPGSGNDLDLHLRGSGPQVGLTLSF